MAAVPPNSAAPQSVLSLSYREKSLKRACDSIRQLFSEVKDISCTELLQLLENPAQAEKTILLDTRQPEELAVSIIPSSNTLSREEFEARKQEFQDPSFLVVTYCTVGYRSAKVARHLQKQGFTNVKNLRGSILGWTQKGYALQTRGGEPTNKVHVYDKRWAWQGNGYEPVMFNSPLLESLKIIMPGWLRRNK